MMANSKSIWRKIQSIPSTLRGFTILMWLLGTFVAIGSLLPGWTHKDNGPASHLEFWQSGAGPMVFLIGIGMMAIGSMIYQGYAWLRHALMLGVVGIVLSGLVHSDYQEIPAGLLIFFGALGIGTGVRYFYFRREIINYFARKGNGEFCRRN